MILVPSTSSNGGKLLTCVQRCGYYIGNECMSHIPVVSVFHGTQDWTVQEQTLHSDGDQQVHFDEAEMQQM